VVTLIGLVAAALAVGFAPEGHEPLRPRPRYRPQRLTTPAHARGRFMAAVVGIFLAFAAGGLFAGLAGTFLAGTLHHPSPALAGRREPARLRQRGRGPGRDAALAAAATAHRRDYRDGHRPGCAGRLDVDGSLPLFLIGGVLVGAGNGAIFRASLSVVIATSGPNDRPGALATFFVAGYTGVSLPVLGMGIALQYVRPQIALMAFALAVGAGLLAAVPALIREKAR